MLHYNMKYEIVLYTVSHKKLDPFSLQHINFGKYWPILIILSLLQT